MIRASTRKRFDQNRTFSQSRARPLSRVRMIRSAIEKNGENRLDNPPSFLLVDTEQRTIERGAEPPPLVIVDRRVRETREQGFGLFCQFDAGYARIGERLIILQRPTNPEGAGRQAAVFGSLEGVPLFLGQGGNVIHRCQTRDVALLQLLENAVGP